MAGLGPFETWRVPPIHTVEDARAALIELQRILETMQFILEQGPGSTGSDADSIRGIDVSDGTPHRDGELLIKDATGPEGVRWVSNRITEGEGIDVVNDTGAITLAAEDASTTNKGIVRLANYLGGTAASPAVRDGTTTQKGAVELATDGERAASVVVQGDDWRLRDEGLVFHPGWIHAGDAAVLLVNTVNTRINLADDLTDDSFSVATFRVPEGWENRDLTVEARINFTSTEVYRLEWAVDDGNAGARSTLSHTGAGQEVLTLSTTTQLAANDTGRRATIILLRDPQHADDTNNNTAFVFWLRIYPT